MRKTSFFVSLIHILFVATPVLAQAIPPNEHGVPAVCLPANPETRAEGAFLQFAYEAASRLDTMARSAGDSFDWCFTQGAGKTYFYTRPDYRRDGIRFSFEDFNRVYALTRSPEEAVITNMWIFSHEMGHAFAYFFKRLNFLPELANHLDELLPREALQFPLADRFALRVSATDAIFGRTFGSEAFADCVGGFTVANGIKTWSEQTSGSLTAVERFMRQVLVNNSMETLMKRVIEIGSSVYDRNRVHGTPAERLSFVSYGLNAGIYYGGRPEYAGNKATTAGIFLCAVNATRANMRHVPGGPEVFFPSFNNGY